MKIINIQLMIMVLLLGPSTIMLEAMAGDTNQDNTQPEVVFETSQGSYTLVLYPDKAPKTVANFLQYVDEGFYNNSLFHRVIPRFVVQGGGFTPGMHQKPTHAPVVNESDNGLKNSRGMISMARTKDPDSASAQFFINVDHNLSLDYRHGKPGYTVFGKVKEGIEVIDKIIKAPTKTQGVFQDVPKEDIIILSAYRKAGPVAPVDNNQPKTDPAITPAPYIAGQHFTLLAQPVATRDSSKIEVVEMFSYGCPHCFEMEASLKAWSNKHSDEIDFWTFPAVWNKSMNLFARAFYVSQELDIIEQTHLPMFSEIVIKQKKMESEQDIADFYEDQGVDKQAVLDAFNSATVIDNARMAEQRVNIYMPAGVPEIIINGKYRIDRMRAGGLAEMLAVADFLINQERELLNKKLNP